MGIIISPNAIPDNFTHQNSFNSLKKKYSIIAKTNMGQNNSFICSHVDSFTPEKGAISTELFSQSYRKCNTVPANDVTAKPKNCHKPIDLFI